MHYTVYTDIKATSINGRNKQGQTLIPLSSDRQVYHTITII